ncbi:hypothetical protein ASPWEDRAFT_35628, partial [Aspergillus wentii DTO 134E9]
MAEKPGDEHVHFTQWALSKGIEIDGVAPAKFPGRGLGMVATRTIQENEHIIVVPVRVMLTIDSVPEQFVKQFPNGTSIHAILAAFLTHGDAEELQKWDVWRKVWPSRESFADSMPVLWPEHLQASSFKTEHPVLLPPAASGVWNSIPNSDFEYDATYQKILPDQQKRLHGAWESVLCVFPDTDWDAFSYHWLIINSRSFFYVTPGKPHPEDWNDAVGLVPFADYFNHADDPQGEVSYDQDQYTIKINRQIEKGEEVYLSYGSHSNDFLFIEYGFFLDDNPSDSIYLDDIIFHDLTKADQHELKLRDCYGDYQITPSGANSRLESVACMKYMDRRDWQKYIQGRSKKGINAQQTAEIICGWIEVYLEESNVAIEKIEAMLPQNQDGKVSMILSRWIQIKRLCEDALSGICSHNDDTN